MRIAIVNDLRLAIEAVRRVILQTSEHQLAWIAEDGAQAVALCARDRPDLILMDLIMPNMDGVEATRRIMAGSPCPIVVVTASVNERSSQVFEAMGAGALDAVDTPVLEAPGRSVGMSALLSKIDTIRRLTCGVAQPQPRGPILSQSESNRQNPPCLIAICASAGGPAALATVLSGLPANFSAPIVVVQHVDEQFAQGLAAWLN